MPTFNVIVLVLSEGALKGGAFAFCGEGLFWGFFVVFLLFLYFSLFFFFFFRKPSSEQC